MPAKNITDYKFTANSKLFLDTNIWVYLYSPMEVEGKHSHRRVEAYSKSFNRMLVAESKLFIDVLVVSEFINSYARRKYQTSDSNIKKFKDYRKSKHFKPIAKEIANAVKKIISIDSIQVVENSFAKLSHESLLDNYASGNFDFNDQTFSELCRDKELILVTDDADFQRQTIPILTANPKLLSKQK